MSLLPRVTFIVFPLLASVWLIGCGTPVNRAPVENRGTYTSTSSVREPVVEKALPVSDTPLPLPGIENEGRPGYYTVRPGDTLIRIGLETGQYWKDLVQWNNLENPDLLLVGQVVRVLPPVPLATANANNDAVSSTGVVSTPVAPPPSVAPAEVAASTADGGSSSAKPPHSVAPPPSTNTVAAKPEPVAVTPSSKGEIQFAWPASGPTIGKFHAERNKGVDISGKAGDPVLASADGRVVYAGTQLRGYGNLIIVKHNDTYLTAYAHNQKLLVKEEQQVKKGQKIAEMGSSDTDRIKLHFEIRRQGKPVDPVRYLPPR